MVSRRATLPQPTEKEFQQSVVDYAQLNGWLVFHDYDSRRSQPGFPDLVMVARGRVVFAELKVGRNRLTPAQLMWAGDLERTPAEYYTWYPKDWEQIEATLRKPRSVRERHNALKARKASA